MTASFDEKFEATRSAFTPSWMKSSSRIRFPKTVSGGNGDGMVIVMVMVGVVGVMVVVVMVMVMVMVSW